MRVRPVNSAANPLIKQYRRLMQSRKHRRETGLIVLEGPNLIDEALKAGFEPESVIFTRRFYERGGDRILSKLAPGVIKAEVAPGLFKQVALTESPQDVAAVFPNPEWQPAKLLSMAPSLAIILDGLQDPGNMGAVIRTGAAAGAGAVFYTPGSVDPSNPKALRSTAGSLFHVPVACAAREQLINGLRDGYQLVVADPRAQQLFWEVSYLMPTAFVIGNESRGASSIWSGETGLKVSIPQHGKIDSLNAAVAAGILLYEAVRQRQIHGHSEAF